MKPNRTYLVVGVEERILVVVGHHGHHGYHGVLVVVGLVLGRL